MIMITCLMRPHIGRDNTGQYHKVAVLHKLSDQLRLVARVTGAS